jgi:thiol-disulfide isomerase/thioredoxin
MNTTLRTIVILILFNLIAFTGFSQGYKISIKVNGIPKDTTCFLAYHFGDKQYLKDTAKVDSKGYFTFDGKKPLDKGIYLAVLPGKKYFEFIVSEQSFTLETDTSDYNKNMKVKGSLENTLFYDFLKFLGPVGKRADSLQKELPNAKSKEDTLFIRAQIDSANKQVENFRRKIIKNNPNTFVAALFKSMLPIVEPSKELDAAEKAKGDSLYNLFRYRFNKGHYWDNITFSEGGLVHSPVYNQKIKDYFTNWVIPNLDSIKKEADWLVKKAEADSNMLKYTIWWITTHYETSQVMGMDAVYVHMVRKYYQTKKAFWVDTATLRKIVDRANLLEPLLLGKVAPKLVLSDSMAKYWALHSIQAKYTILYFWDPNCGHCQKETPKLYDVYLKYKSKGVAAYAVNIDRDRKKWIDYINKNKLNWINVYDPNYYVSFKQLYDIYSTPVIYILNDKKEIIAKRLGVDQVDDLLSKSLKIPKEEKKETKTEEKKGSH